MRRSLSFTQAKAEHGEVVALLCVAHKVGDSLRHTFNEFAGLL